MKKKETKTENEMFIYLGCVRIFIISFVSLFRSVVLSVVVFPLHLHIFAWIMLHLVETWFGGFFFAPTS